MMDDEQLVSLMAAILTPYYRGDSQGAMEMALLICRRTHDHYERQRHIATDKARAPGSA